MRKLLLLALFFPVLAHGVVISSVFDDRLEITRECGSTSADSTMVLPWSIEYGGTAAAVEYAVFCMPGDGKDTGWYTAVKAKLVALGLTDDTAIIGIQPVENTDLDSPTFRALVTDEMSMIPWDETGYSWRGLVYSDSSGTPGDSTYRPFTISFADVMDTAYVRLQRDYFPNLKAVTVSAYAGGGNACQRHQFVRNEDLQFSGMRVRHVYFSSGTPTPYPSTSRPNTPDKALWTTWSAVASPNDNWPFGLSNIGSIVTGLVADTSLAWYDDDYTRLILPSDAGDPLNNTGAYAYLGSTRRYRNTNYVDAWRRHALGVPANMALHIIHGLDHTEYADMLDDPQAEYWVFYDMRDENQNKAVVRNDLISIDDLADYEAVTGTPAANVVALFQWRPNGMFCLTSAGLTMSHTVTGTNALAGGPLGNTQASFFADQYITVASPADYIDLTNGAAVAALQLTDGMLIECLFQSDTTTTQNLYNTDDASVPIRLSSGGLRPRVESTNYLTLGNTYTDGAWHLATFYIGADSIVYALDGGKNYYTVAHGRADSPYDSGTDQVRVGGSVAGTTSIHGSVGWIAVVQYDAGLEPSELYDASGDQGRTVMTDTWEHIGSYLNGKGMFLSVQAATDWIGSQATVDTCFVRDDTYLTLARVKEAGVTVLGESLSGVIFDGDSTGTLNTQQILFNDRASTWRFKRATLQDGPSGYKASMYTRAAGLASYLHFKDVTYGIGVQQASSAPLIVDYCTFTGADSAGVWVVNAPAANAANVTIRNSVLSSNYRGIRNDNTGYTFADTYNLYYSNTDYNTGGTGDAWTTTGQVIADPLFYSATDWRIKYKAPLLGNDAVIRGAWGYYGSVGSSVARRFLLE